MAKKTKQLTEVVPAETQPATTKKSPKPVKKILIVSLVIILIAAVGASGYFYWQYKKVQDNPTAAVNQKNTQETKNILKRLQKLILIESNEAPTVARIENPDSLKSNNAVFYKNVQKGDYLILYKDRAIIYRQANNQIINVAPIVNNQQNNQPDNPTKK